MAICCKYGDDVKIVNVLSVARRFVADYNIMRLSIGEAMRNVLDTQPNTELSHCILSYLHEGHTVPDELAVRALEVNLMDMKCKTRGSVFRVIGALKALNIFVFKNR